ncbi:hypothetical protein [Paractinoplanes toevensis]|uniref:hypothetical protein n=1 Tax=Paractinoplanes toevensis TaxID=571911 RepID=UPI001BB41BA7|nr:hypothetical protein [Actinoplanes toevensis]
MHATAIRAYQHFGITAEVLPVGVVIHDPDGNRTQYATDRPPLARRDQPGRARRSAATRARQAGRPDHQAGFRDPGATARPGHRTDPRTEPPRPTRRRNQLRLTARRPAHRVPTVQPDDRDRLLGGPLLVRNDAQYRRAGINLAALVVQALRDASIIDRLRQTRAFPHLLALLDTIGDAPINLDESTGDVLVDLPDGPVRLDQVPAPGR